MIQTRLDQALVARGLTTTRSQAESYIKLGKVKVNKRVITKTGYFISESDRVELTQQEQYVSRAALKLASVADKFKLNFKGKIVLDVGSSTGGFTDYALRQGAEKVIAVDVGTDQLHPSLRTNPRIELREKTDIRDMKSLNTAPDIVVIDVSFISLRLVLPHVAGLCGPTTRIVAMVKPQFEAGKDQVNKGIVKNDTVRRSVLKDFEDWTRRYFVIVAKADSEVAGGKGNLERFCLLKKIS